MTRRTSVWLNTSFNCVPSIRRGDTQREFEIQTSYHSRKYQAETLLADSFELEPEGAQEAYDEFALEFAKRRRIDVILPGRKQETLAKRVDDFASIGVRIVLAADATTLHTLANKAAFYDALGSIGVPLPRYTVASSANEFTEAVRQLERDVPVVCYKPVVGTYGAGFGVLRTKENVALLSKVERSLLKGIDEALETLSQGETFPKQIVLEYLAGEECSVDCLGHEGRIIRSVVRMKHTDGARTIESSTTVEGYAARIAERFGVSGLFNIQFKRHGGTWHVLEINTRMSGGIGMSCLSGVEFPYWAIRYALGPVDEDEIPHPITGLRVTEARQAVLLGRLD